MIPNQTLNVESIQNDQTIHWSLFEKYLANQIKGVNNE